MKNSIEKIIKTESIKGLSKKMQQEIKGGISLIKVCSPPETESFGG